MRVKGKRGAGNLVSYDLSMPRIRQIEFVIAFVTLNNQDCQND